jgi:hypothetical protein
MQQHCRCEGPMRAALSAAHHPAALKLITLDLIAWSREANGRNQGQTADNRRKRQLPDCALRSRLKKLQTALALRRNSFDTALPSW